MIHSNLMISWDEIIKFAEDWITTQNVALLIGALLLNLLVFSGKKVTIYGIPIQFPRINNTTIKVISIFIAAASLLYSFSASGVISNTQTLGAIIGYVMIVNVVLLYLVFNLPTTSC